MVRILLLLLFVKLLQNLLELGILQLFCAANSVVVIVADVADIKSNVDGLIIAVAVEVALWPSNIGNCDGDEHNDDNDTFADDVDKCCKNNEAVDILLLLLLFIIFKLLSWFVLILLSLLFKNFAPPKQFFKILLFVLLSELATFEWFVNRTECRVGFDDIVDGGFVLVLTTFWFKRLWTIEPHDCALYKRPPVARWNIPGKGMQIFLWTFKI